MSCVLCTIYFVLTPALSHAATIYARTSRPQVVAVITIFPAKEPTELVKERKVVSRAIPMSEVQEHNKAADCWVAMEGKVYDITKYVEEHPGGEAAISKYAGQDISVPFRGDQHGSQVDDVIANYYIGELVDAK